MLGRGSGLSAAVTIVDKRPVRSLSAGELQDLPEVVVLPGLGAPGYLVPWVQRIACWTKATILDLPGWRRGWPRVCPPTVEDIARSALAWLEAADRERVVLLGHSTGANAARRAALLGPERLAGVVLAGPTFDPAARNWPTLVRRTIETMRHESAAELPAVLPDYLASGGHGLARLIRSGMKDRPEDEVDRLQVPALVITGERDGFAPPGWAGRLAEIAGAPCVVLPGAHNCCFTHPDHADAALRRTVLDWTSSQP
jgi:pimeloyl-ACP methyl ester carboxylesterase